MRVKKWSSVQDTFAISRSHQTEAGFVNTLQHSQLRTGNDMRHTATGM